LAQAAQLREAFARIAELKRRPNDLLSPPKTQGNSSLPPSIGRKPNRPHKPKPKGLREGSIGLKGGGRALCDNPDEVVTAKPVRCRC
jgi:hypothetical protein